jgi:hypothetical protein
VITFDDKVTHFTGINQFYSISFQWYVTFGTIVTVFVGIVVSLFTGGRWQTINDDYILCDLLGFLSPDRVKKAKRSHQLEEIYDAKMHDNNIKF